MMMGLNHNAYQDVLTACELDPHIAKYEARAGKCALLLGALPDAQMHYAAALKLDTANDAYKAELAKALRCLGLYQTVDEAIEEGSYDSAHGLLDEARVLVPAATTRSRLLGLYASLREDGTDSAVEIDEIEALIDESERSDVTAEELSLAGRCFYYLGDLASADDLLNAAIDANPDDSSVALDFLEDLVSPLQELKARGKSHFAAGQYGEANAAYSEAIELALENPHVLAKLYYNRALTHGKMGSADEAIADCTKAVELDTGYDNFVVVVPPLPCFPVHSRSFCTNAAAPRCRLPSHMSHCPR